MYAVAIERRRRVRRTVIVGALGVFAGVWVWLASQMAAGNDPVLSAKRQAPKAQSSSQLRLIQTPEGLAVVPAQSEPSSSVPPPVTQSS
jgi:hypothetical protein